MGSIEIKKDFYINGKVVKIISGAVHYFRIVPEYWEDTLLDLIDMGCNTVETYVPWNLHEPKQGEYDFDGIKDIERFLSLAHQLGLYVILRASPYICAEWEMGGLPAWLLKYPGIRLRSDDEQYMKCLEQYFSILLPKVSQYQIHKNGSIILAQLENEYGSYGEDKEYLKKVFKLMRDYGIQVPVFTADGTWNEALEAGSLINGDVFPTGNFGSHAKENMEILEKFMQRHDIEAPLMCMEFWDGWFNRWNQEIIRRNPQEFIESVKEMLEIGSVNFYMFQGGTNFGWMNGCSARKEKDFPQITSYDYDAILTEYGAKTEKYHLMRELITGEQHRLENRRKTCSYGSVKCKNRVSLFSVIEQISTIIENSWPLTMEELDHYYGYVVYQHDFQSYTKQSRLRVIDARDRIQIYVNNKFIGVQYQEEIGDEILFETSLDNQNDLKILVENMGRVNYGAKLQADTQKKGIRTGVLIDIHFTKKWKHYCLNFNKTDAIDWSKEYIGGPAFHQFVFTIDEIPNETFIDVTNFGKGIVLVNGHHCGRFYQVGPTGSLYIPGPFLKRGENIIVIFETEGVFADEIILNDKPIYIDIHK